MSPNHKFQSKEGKRNQRRKNMVKRIIRRRTISRNITRVETIHCILGQVETPTNLGGLLFAKVQSKSYDI